MQMNEVEMKSNEDPSLRISNLLPRAMPVRGLRLALALGK